MQQAYSRRSWLRHTLGSVIAAVLALTLCGCASHGGDASATQPGSTATATALPSWRDGAARQAILKFVADVTHEGSPGYVRPADRIAVFDNDGTLWSEQPLYFQFVFMLDQVKAAAPNHPEWKNNPAFKALMAHDYAALASQQKPLLELVAAANSGMTVDAYDQTIRDWLAKARHPKFNRPYTDLVYQPQLELLAYLRANGFKTFIVSGGTIEFMRPWAEKAYGIPPEQVMQYTAGGGGEYLALLVHHDDAAREFAYDRQSKIGKLDKAWDEAVTRHWIVVSMKDDWKTIYPQPKQ